MDKKYENQELIDKVDKISNEILAQKGHMYIRERFFGAMIDKMGLKTGAEIGVDVGEFSGKLLSGCTLEKLYGVDFWPSDFGSDFRPDFFIKEGGTRYQQCQKNLEKFIQEGRVELVKSDSVVAATKFEDNSLDFVYIDGDHSLQGIMFDTYAFTPKIRIGGICAGHDYKDGANSGVSGWDGKQLDYKVKTVVDYFCQRFGYKLNVVGGIVKSWWFVRSR